MPEGDSTTPLSREQRRMQRLRANPALYEAYLERKRKERRKQQKDRQYETIRKRKWRAANPEKTRLLRQAHHAVENAIKSWRLIRPSHCEGCGSECTPEAHHHRGYEREFWLIVKWLCEMCHKAEHRKEIL